MRAATLFCLLPACIVLFNHPRYVNGNDVLDGVLGQVSGLTDVITDNLGPLEDQPGYLEFKNQFTNDEWDAMSTTERQTLLLQFTSTALSNDDDEPDKQGGNEQFVFLGLHYLKDFTAFAFNKSDPYSDVIKEHGLEWRYLKPTGCCRTQPGKVGVSAKFKFLSFKKCQVMLDCFRRV